ncbi:MAG: hypothetical protein HUJ67_02775 [Ruminiclostridium sp.]|nr:hypothetical protein [Ruminiclostridium sp.]
MILKLNNVDVTHLIAPKGLNYERKRDYQTVTTLDGYNHYGRVTLRKNLTVNFVALTGEDFQQIAGLVDAEYIEVEYRSEAFDLIKKLHVSGYTLGLITKIGEDELWEGVSITLDDYQGG